MIRALHIWVVHQGSVGSGSLPLFLQYLTFHMSTFEILQTNTNPNGTDRKQYDRLHDWKRIRWPTWGADKLHRRHLHRICSWRSLSSMGSQPQRCSCPGMDFLRCEILRFGCYRRDSFHTRRWTLSRGVETETKCKQLLAPAHEALTNECLTGPITEYDWVEGICLISIFFLFIVEVMVMRFAKFGHSHSHDHGHGHDPEHGRPLEAGSSSPKETDQQPQKYQDNPSKTELSEGAAESSVGGNDQCPVGPYAPGDDHLSHAREHVDSHGEPSRTFEPDSYTAQMTALFILEFGMFPGSSNDLILSILTHGRRCVPLRLHRSHPGCSGIGVYHTLRRIGVSSDL